MVGRTNNVASAETRLSNTGTAPGLNVTSTNPGGGARAIGAIANGGYGAYVESAANNGASIWTKHRDKWAVVTVNGGASGGAGGAVRADGRQNAGLLATTANRAATAVTARNTGANADELRSSAVVGTVGPHADAPLSDIQSRYWHGAGAFAGANGVVGVTTQTSGYGVAGFATKLNAAGVYATTLTPDGYALVASGKSTMGDLQVTGTLTKPGGSFRIDHPLDPANKYLSHSFVESPDMKNIYDGVVTTDANGQAVVTLPDWFEALNEDFRYQLTAIGEAAPTLHVRRKVANGEFAIAGAAPGQEVSWQLTGIRRDAWAKEHRIPVEHPKSKADRGRYLFPEGFGQPQSAELAGPPRRM